MCGIVGYIGKNQAQNVLIDGLVRLEYRGYDSAGVAVINKKRIVKHEKAVGKVEELTKKINGEMLDGHTGVAHTRWATHGKVTKTNAHPHTGSDETIWLVHNGIIENYQPLRNSLKKKGRTFKTETDSEVIAQLIEQEHQTQDFEHAVSAAIKKLRGAFGLVIMSKNEPEKLIAVRNSSPLVLGVGDDEFIIASDPSAIVNYTKKVVYLNDGEIATITNDRYHVKSFEQEMKRKPIVVLEWNETQAQKGGHKHFTMKEILEQPEALTNTMRGRLLEEEGIARLGGLSDMKSRLKKVNRITIVSMGTAYFAAQIGKLMIEEYTNIPVEVEYSSEFMYRASILDDKSAVVAISQSGETIETLGAIREAKRRGALTLGIVNSFGSTIARETDAGVYNHAGPEIGVASTKAFTSQLVILTLLTIILGRQRAMSPVIEERIIQELAKIPKLIGTILKNREEIMKIGLKYVHYDHMFCLGRKYQQPVGFEAALKIKELSYLHAEGLSMGLLKHGSIALIDNNFPSLVFVPKDSVYKKNIASIQEIKARGGKVIAITTQGNKELDSMVDDVITIPKTLEMLTPILSVIPAQLIAYSIADARKLDVDKPRNLAKSVTVE